MNTRETLVFKTLAWKQTLNGSGHGDLVDHLLEQNPEQADTLTEFKAWPDDVEESK